MNLVILVICMYPLPYHENLAFFVNFAHQSFAE